MKLPSIKYLIDEALQSAKRFPLTLLSAVVGVSVAVYLVEFESDISNVFPLVNLMLVSALGLVGFFGIAVFNEQENRSNMAKVGLNFLGAAILVLIYFSLPSAEHTNMGQPYIRYAIYNVVAHLLVSFAPFLSKGRINGFWQYNKMLFLRICLSVLYSAFVFIGIALAMVSLNLLFDADIDEKTFFQLWIVVVGIFNTWFFLSGINSKVDEHEQNRVYPNGLKTFSQYVLLPLLILYLVILYSYIIKIIGLWDWPEGIVSYLIVCVAVLGIFTILLFHPYQNPEQKDWIAIFSKVYYYTLLPLTITLFIAIGIRINDYGLTVNRYLIVELGVWLLFVSMYFIIGKRNIKVIPMSLAAMVLLTSFGFWGMFSVSENSQVNRLERILVENGILVNGKIQNEPILTVENDTLFFLDKMNLNESLLNDSLKNEVYSILNYLDDFHGFDELNQWYSKDPDSVQTAIKGDAKYYYYNGAKMRMELMGLAYQYSYYNYLTNQRERRSNYHNEDYASNAMKVTGYDYVLDIDQYNHVGIDNADFDEFTLDEHSFFMSQKSSLQFLIVSDTHDTLFFDLKPMISSLSRAYGEGDSYRTDQETMSAEFEGVNYKAKLIVNSLAVIKNTDVRIESLNGVIMIKKKE